MATGNKSGQAGGSVPLYAESELVQATAATDFITLTGAASQTGDFLVLRDSSAVERAWITSVGAAQFGEAATGQIVAGGTTMVYGRAVQKTTALTGDLIGMRGNARVVIASAAGAAYGGYFQAGSGSSATGADAVNVSQLYGVLAEIVTAAASATVEAAYGLKVSMDIDAATTVITTAIGAWISMGSGSSGGTVTNSAGVVIINEDVQGTGKVYGAGLAIGNISRAVGFTYLIDLNPSILLHGTTGTVVGCSGHSADIRFSNNAWFVALTGTITANSTTTSAPAGSIGITTGTGSTKSFRSDGTKWQFSAIT